MVDPKETWIVQRYNKWDARYVLSAKKVALCLEMYEYAVLKTSAERDVFASQYESERSWWEEIKLQISIKDVDFFQK